MAELERVVHFDGDGLSQPVEVVWQHVRDGHAPMDDYYLRSYRTAEVDPLATLSLESQDNDLAEVTSRSDWALLYGEKTEYPKKILHLHEVAGRQMPLKQAAMLTFAAISGLAGSNEYPVGLIRRGELREEDEPFEDLAHLKARVLNKRDNFNLVADPGYIGEPREILDFATHALRVNGIYVAKYLPGAQKGVA